MRGAVLVVVTACAVSSMAPSLAATPTGAQRENLGEDLYWASVDATGARLCDREKSEEFRAEFDRRYGKRVRALVAAHEAQFGRDPPFIVTSSCTLWRGRESELDERHRRAMDKFEDWLAAAERTSKVRP